MRRGLLKRRVSIEVAAEPTEPPRKLKHPAATLLAILDDLGCVFDFPSFRQGGFQAYREKHHLSEKDAAEIRDEIVTHLPKESSDKSAFLEALSLSEKEIAGLTPPVG